ncbi:MAG: prolipoprotein diacylglyceryl transferase [Chloroflexi bacterium]|nr:prolipoprotein diacylglyceryl transferase [Chloroflexota bacterium]
MGSLPATALAIEIPWDPSIVTLGGLILTWHGLFTAVGVLGGMWIALRLADRTGYDPDHVYSIALAAVPAGIVGARALFVAEHWEVYGSNPGQILALTEGGISIWGAILGGFLGGTLYAWWQGFPIATGLDIGAPTMLLGQAIGRLGDLVNGEHLATATDLPWGVLYTHPDSPAFAHSLAVGAHHPATTYELLGDLAIMGLLLALYFRSRWFRPRPGLLFLAYLVGYASMRFFLTYVRVDSAEAAGGLLRVPQLVSVIVVLVAVPLAIWVWRRRPAGGVAHAP